MDALAPWGFVATTHGFTAITTVSERRARAALGEFAISLFGRLGVTEEMLERITMATDPLEALQRVQEEQMAKAVKRVEVEAAPSLSTETTLSTQATLSAEAENVEKYLKGEVLPLTEP